jgi:hypothetical protein
MGGIWVALASSYMKDVIEFGEHVVGQRHLMDDPALAALQGDVGAAAVQVDRCGRERQDFGNPAAGQTQNNTKELHVQGRAARRLDEAPTLSGVEIFPAAG